MGNVALTASEPRITARMTGRFPRNAASASGELANSCGVKSWTRTAKGAGEAEACANSEEYRSGDGQRRQSNLRRIRRPESGVPRRSPLDRRGQSLLLWRRKRDPNARLPRGESAGYYSPSGRGQTISDQGKRSVVRSAAARVVSRDTRRSRTSRISRRGSPPDWSDPSILLRRTRAGEEENPKNEAITAGNRPPITPMTRMKTGHCPLHPCHPWFVSG